MTAREPDSWRAVAYDFGLDLTMLEWAQAEIRNWPDRADDANLGSRIERVTFWAPERVAEFVGRVRGLQLPRVGFTS